MNAFLFERIITDIVSASLLPFCSRKNSKVQISRVRVEDSGNYTCVAENSVGQENATSIISVQICENNLFLSVLLSMC